MDWSKHKVFVHGPGAFAYQKMFLKRGLKGTDDLDKATIVCFTGGADVNPVLYGEDMLYLHGSAMSGYDEARDNKDATVHGYAVASEAFQVGICRGGQFLNVMNGGKMWQHVTGHAGCNHQVMDTITNNTYLVSSTHHQMMRPGADAEIVAVAREARAKYAATETWYLTEADKSPVEWFDDPEVLWYPSTRSLCFQPHPEFNGVEECTNYFFELIERYI